MRIEFPYKRPFLAYLKAVRNYSAHTQTAYIKDLDQFFTFKLKTSSDDTLDGIGSTLARSWVRSMAADQIAAKSIHRKLSSLKTYLKFLYQQKHISEAISIQVQFPKLRRLFLLM